MPVDSTSSNDSHLHLSPINPFYPFDLCCFFNKPACWIFTIFAVANVALLLPLCVLVLRHGLQQRRKQSFSSTTHADTFTYHLVLMELIHILGCILCVCGIYEGHWLILIIWLHLFSLTYYGESLFHVLTCVEHYLAVVHPVAYLSLRTERWIQLRSVVIGCIWLSCLGLMSLIMTGTSYLMVDLCLSALSVISISFCSLSVLCALALPGPGGRGKERVRGRQKRRALHTIVAILGLLLLRCLSLLVSAAQSVKNGGSHVCMMTLMCVWMNLPSSFLLPLLYTHKAGMLACLKKNR